ncbi:hypothetical protein PPERSA_10010 [Pseudocohnilembus persalinus]|uniref:Uncharacterized protein n=1 Tax=Pseudocohnilembus persalinus TaxID=266149 RepID=A0A0V0QJF4_PSEPJ|nr:hypothetical protein PPERSA_10010 [Pseudocohnilembus persalinus]|eukprot:KRX02393.1 hypothetical protein PPERSA_10010 [Pseudocohnilembus persalinus]
MQNITDLVTGISIFFHYFDIKYQRQILIDEYENILQSEYQFNQEIFLSDQNQNNNLNTEQINLAKFDMELQVILEKLTYIFEKKIDVMSFTNFKNGITRICQTNIDIGVDTKRKMIDYFIKNINKQIDDQNKNIQEEEKIKFCEDFSKVFQILFRFRFNSIMLKDEHAICLQTFNQFIFQNAKYFTFQDLANNISPFQQLLSFNWQKIDRTQFKKDLNNEQLNNLQLNQQGVYIYEYLLIPQFINQLKISGFNPQNKEKNLILALNVLWNNCLLGKSQNQNQNEIFNILLENYNLEELFQIIQNNSQASVNQLLYFIIGTQYDNPQLYTKFTTELQFLKQKSLDIIERNYLIPRSQFFKQKLQKVLNKPNDQSDKKKHSFDIINNLLDLEFKFQQEARVGTFNVDFMIYDLNLDILNQLEQKINEKPEQQHFILNDKIKNNIQYVIQKLNKESSSNQEECQDGQNALQK